MDRDAELRRWLATPRRTWRWNRGETEGYDAVEASGAVLRWYRWSHRAEGGGAHDLVLQAREAFLRDGPPRPTPAGGLDQLRAHLASEQSE